MRDAGGERSTVPTGRPDRRRRIAPWAAGVLLGAMVTAACGSGDPPALVGSDSPTTTSATPSTQRLLPSVPADSSPTTGPAAAGPTSTTRSGVIPVATPPGLPGPASGATRVQVVPEAVDLRARPFESAEAIADRTVAVRFYSGVAPCEVVGRADVSETADAVTITLYGGRDPRPGDDVACIMIAVYNELLVPLSNPLAGRPIVDGAA